MMATHLRDALRSLRRSPGFTALAAGTLALGIGASTAIFSVVNAVLLEKLPFARPETLVMIWERHLPDGNPRNTTSPANFLAWRREATAFEAMGAIFEMRTIVSGGEGESESVQMRIATPSVFSLLGTRAQVGRLFTPDEERESAPRVAVLSHRLWQQRFGGRTDIVGRTIRVHGDPAVVVGVLPRDFGFFDEDVDVWLPIQFTAEDETWGGRYLRVLARLRPGTTLASANAEMAAIAARRAQAFPELDANWTARVEPLQETLVGDSRPALLLLLGAVGLLLLIACANVANLQLVRGAARRKDLAIRTSLGASPGLLGTQLLTESVVLSVAAGLLGFLAASWGTDLLVRLIPSDVPLPRLDRVTLDARVLAFATTLALLTGLTFGWLPALSAARANVSDMLKEGGRASRTGRLGSRLRNGLVVAELALAVVLLAAAGLMLRSFVQLQEVQPGFDTRQVLAAEIALPASYEEPVQQVSFFERVEERVAALPGVREVGAISFLPFSGERSASGFVVEDRPTPPQGEESIGDMRAVTPGYFRAMGIPIKEGRAIAAADRADAPDVAVVSETLARRFWPGRSPIGKRLRYEWDEEENVEIVGVAGDVRHEGPATEPYMEIYRPLAQFPYGTMTLVVRTASEPGRLAPSIRREVRVVDREQPVAEVRTLAAMQAETLGSSRSSTFLFGVFAVVGVLLAVVGVYGLTAYSVTQRRHEIGIRSAIGARPRDVLSLVLRQGASLAALGVVAGTAFALALTRLMRALLFETSPAEPSVYAGVALLLGAVAMLASWVPARRAARISPLIALREE